MFRAKLTTSARLEAWNRTTGLGEPSGVVHLRSKTGARYYMDTPCKWFWTGRLPFVHYDGMSGSRQGLGGRRDETGVDEELLLGPGSGRNLEVDNLASFVCIGLCGAGPGCWRRKAAFVVTK